MINNDNMIELSVSTQDITISIDKIVNEISIEIEQNSFDVESPAIPLPSGSGFEAKPFPFYAKKGKKVSINHNFGTKAILCSVYDNNGLQHLISINHHDQNTLIIGEFGEDMSGYVLILGRMV